MARKTSPQGKTGKDAGKKGRRTNWTALWIFVLFIGLVTISLPTVVLLGIAMLPTGVAFIIDRSYQRSATYCVAGMNFCGVFPYLLDLWLKAHSLDAALDILKDVYALLLIYGAAGFGWLVFMTMPPVIATFLAVMAQHRVTQLRVTQRDILAEWGEGVAKTDAVQSARAGTRKHR